MYVSETTVLKPRDPAIQDENAWEEFRLSNADARDQKTGALVSLLVAGAETPVTVRGKLELESGQARFLRKGSRGNGTSIELKDVCRFAYGQYDDGAVEIWALGEAGWFKMRPSRSYREVFQSTARSVKMLYFLADAYRDVMRRKKGGLPSPVEIFASYAKQDPMCKTPQDAAEAFHAQREFLIITMLQDKEGVKWGATPFYMHMRRKFPNDFIEASRKLTAKPKDKPAPGAASPVAPPQPKPAASKPAASKPAASRHTAAKPPAPKSRASSIATHTHTGSRRDSVASRARPKEDELPKSLKKDDAWFRTQVVWRLMQTAQEQSLLDSDEMTVNGVANLMVQQYDIDNPTVAANYLRAHASILSWLMAKNKSKFDWTAEAMYDELSNAVIPRHAAESLSQLRIRRRRDIVLPQDADESSDDDATSADELLPPRGKGKSVLRPKSTKFFGIGKHPNGDASGFGSDDSWGGPSATPSKRKADDRDGDSATQPRKRPATQGPDLPSDEGIDVDSDSDAASSLADGVAGGMALPLRWKQPGDRTDGDVAATPVIVSESTGGDSGPNAPGDVWACPHDGCVHRVYAASSAASRELVAEHQHEHGERDGQVELVQREGAGSQLPVGNLIKRIRAMAEKQQQLFPSTPDSAAAKVVQPIRRRY